MLTRGNVCLSSRRKSIAQKQVAPGTFDAHERPPEGMLWRKKFAHDESGALDLPVAPGNLRSQRQEQLVQGLLGKKVANQLRSTLDQDHLTLADTADRQQDGSSTERTGALDRAEFDAWWETLCADTL